MSTTMNNVGRPTTPNAANVADVHASLTGGRGLLQDEPLLFELGGWDKTGVDLDAPDHDASDLGDLVRTAPIGLAGLSEPETLRHYVRLSQKNHAIDLALYPLGSCTMKHNPRLNEKAARMAGFADLHPLQPQSPRPGARLTLDRPPGPTCARRRSPACRPSRITPKAGAHGELSAAFSDDQGRPHEAAGHGDRRRVLVPTSRPRQPTPPPPAFVGYSRRGDRPDRRRPRRSRRPGSSSSGTPDVAAILAGRPTRTPAASSSGTSSRSRA